MARPRVRKGGGAYFGSPNSSLEFINTGCELLNCVLGGGYPLGRIVNVVGDKSTGKTLLAIEACANFCRQYPKGMIWYNEAEAAFDKPYAQALGLPLGRIDFPELPNTVEAVFSHMEGTLKLLDGKHPGLYIQDSLDALSDAAEMDRGIEEGSYGAEKAKKMSQLFRRLVKELGKKKVCVFIISQVRDAIGVSFGRKTTRSGGRALDFYASLVLYLAQIERIKKTVEGITRPIGVKIRAKCDKSKVGLPFRECDFEIKFGYGIDDLAASFDWLLEVGKLDELDLSKNEIPRILRKAEAMDSDEFEDLRKSVSEVVREQWYKIEKGFLPRRTKYAEE